MRLCEAKVIALSWLIDEYRCYSIRRCSSKGKVGQVLELRFGFSTYKPNLNSRTWPNFAFGKIFVVVVVVVVVVST